jgi:uncharacterized protein (TIGR02271 family)
VRGFWDDHDRFDTDTEGDTLQLKEEELVAQKRTVESGRVEVEKDVVTEHRTLDVPVTREEVVVERRPVDRRPSDRPIGEGGEEIDVTVREEEVSVEKRPVVYEEVEVGKRAVQETRQVGAEVRREVAEVHREGEPDVRGDLPRTPDRDLPRTPDQPRTPDRNL